MVVPRCWAVVHGGYAAVRRFWYRLGSSHIRPTPNKRFITGDTLVVDGAAWIYRPQLVPREMVTQLSRGIEAKSRKVGTAAAATRSKL